MKVLAAADNQTFRELLPDYLPESVDEIYECAGGNQAFSLIDKFHPEWVVMDRQMLKTEAITTTCEIIAEYPNAKICRVTSDDDEVLRTESLKAGAIKFVLKGNLSELPEILIGESK